MKHSVVYVDFPSTDRYKAKCDCGWACTFPTRDTAREAGRHHLVCYNKPWMPKINEFPDEELAKQLITMADINEEADKTVTASILRIAAERLLKNVVIKNKPGPLEDPVEWR